MIIIATDSTSYPNMILYTMANDDGSLRRYELAPAENYVLHDHRGCDLGDPEYDIEPECYYTRRIYLPLSTDLTTINDTYEAVLESTVPENNIFGNTDKPEIM